MNGISWSNISPRNCTPLGNANCKTFTLLLLGWKLLHPGDQLAPVELDLAADGSVPRPIHIVAVLVDVIGAQSPSRPAAPFIPKSNTASVSPIGTHRPSNAAKAAYLNPLKTHAFPRFGINVVKRRRPSMDALTAKAEVINCPGSDIYFQRFECCFVRPWPARPRAGLCDPRRGTRRCGRDSCRSGRYRPSR